LADSRIILKQQILQSSIPDVAYFAAYVNLAFPEKLQRFRKQFQDHRLRREIISTELTNEFTTLLGITFIYELQKDMDVAIPDILCAYAVALEIFSIKPLWYQLRALNVAAELKRTLMLELCSILRHAIKWILRNYSVPLQIEVIIKKLKNNAILISKNLADFVVGYEAKILQDKFNNLLLAKIPVALARVPLLNQMTDSILNVAEIVRTKKTNLHLTANVYFKLRDKLELYWLFERLNKYIPTNIWEFAAKNNLRNNLDLQQRQFVVLALQALDTGSWQAVFNAWLTKNANFYQHWQQIFFEIKQADVKEFAIIYMMGMELLVLATRFNLSIK